MLFVALVAVWSLDRCRISRPVAAGFSCRLSSTRVAPLSVRSGYVLNAGRWMGTLAAGFERRTRVRYQVCFSRMVCWRHVPPHPWTVLANSSRGSHACLPARLPGGSRVSPLAPLTPINIGVSLTRRGRHSLTRAARRRAFIKSRLAHVQPPRSDALAHTHAHGRSSATMDVAMSRRN